MSRVDKVARDDGKKLRNREGGEEGGSFRVGLMRGERGLLGFRWEGGGLGAVTYDQCGG